MRDVAIKRVMTTNPVTVSPEDSIEHAQSLIEVRGLHHLPVVDAGRLVGLISSADLLKCYLLDGGSTAAHPASVRAIMAADPVSLDAGASLRDAAVKLAAGGFHALPVVEPDGSLVGIVTSSDLIEHLLHQIPTNDGSLRLPALDRSADSPPTAALHDDDVRSAVGAARDLLDGGEDNLLARAVLDLKERQRKMQAVCQAAEHYVRSGRAEREHSILVKSLGELRSSAQSIYL